MVDYRIEPVSRSVKGITAATNAGAKFANQPSIGTLALRNELKYHKQIATFWTMRNYRHSPKCISDLYQILTVGRHVSVIRPTVR